MRCPELRASTVKSGLACRGSEKSAEDLIEKLNYSSNSGSRKEKRVPTKIRHGVYEAEEEKLYLRWGLGPPNLSISARISLSNSSMVSWVRKNKIYGYRAR